MAEMTIRLIPDPTTGKKNIIISLTGDEESLPHEHEHLHRAIVDRLLGKAKIKASEIGQITIEREEKEEVPALPSGSSSEGHREPTRQGH
ncbi:MAG: hypothetical protein ACKO23_16845 [Gemmataceae bacterium]